MSRRLPHISVEVSKRETGWVAFAWCQCGDKEARGTACGQLAQLACCKAIERVRNRQIHFCERCKI